MFLCFPRDAPATSFVEILLKVFEIIVMQCSGKLPDQISIKIPLNSFGP